MWKKILLGLIFMISIQTISVQAADVAKSDSQSVQLTVKNQIQGDLPSEKETYTYRLTSEGSVLQEIEIKGEGEKAFDALTFEDTGKYEYQIYQVKGSNNYGTYDKTVYTAVIYIEWDNNTGALAKPQVWAYDGEAAEEDFKVAEIEFINAYDYPSVDVKPSTPQTGDSNNLILPIMMILLSFSGIIALLIFRRKKSNKNKL